MGLHGWDQPGRSPIGLVVGSCTSHPGFLGSIPKREEPGKTGAPAPCVKVPGSSRVPRSPKLSNHGRVQYSGGGPPGKRTYCTVPPPREQLCNRSCSNKHTSIDRPFIVLTETKSTHPALACKSHKVNSPPPAQAQAPRVPPLRALRVNRLRVLASPSGPSG